MNAGSILTEAKAAGIELRHAGDILKMSAEAKPDEGLVARIKAAELVIITHLRSLEAERGADNEFALYGCHHRSSGNGPVAPSEWLHFPPGGQLGERGVPVFDTSEDHLLGDGIVRRAVLNQRRAMIAQAGRAIAMADAALSAQSEISRDI